jgi:hypothetical protein
MIKLLRMLMIVFIILNLPKPVFATHFITQSTVNCRPLAMGGAFTAVNDNLAAFSYNPATFKQYLAPKDFRLTFYVNPLATGVSLSRPNGVENLRELGKSLGFFLKSVTFSARNFEGGVFFSEEAISNYRLNTRDTFFSSQGFWDNYSHQIGLRLALAQQVAIGMATTFYYSSAQEGERWGVGNSYGVLLKPDQKYSVGVFYIALPVGFAKNREQLERLVDDTVNIGVTYCPWDGATLALDLRSINAEKSINSRELHFGLEQLVRSVFAIRAGYFQERSQKQVISGGIGLLADNLFFRKHSHFQPPHFLFDYAFILEQEKSADSMWHFFSCKLRF